MFTVRGTWMRGGTSKCWLFTGVDIDPLVSSEMTLDDILVAAFGSGDPRQIDGIGGGSSTTSKAAIVRRSALTGVDVDYLFAQVAIADCRVEWSSNCGNCATAIGLYALQTGMVAVQSPVTRVRMRNENTGDILTAEIATPGGRIPFDGDATVPGATAPGVPVVLTFEKPAVAPWPTGNAVDDLVVDGVTYRATMVQAGAPAVLVDWRSFGLDEGGVLDTARVTALMPTLIRIRRAAALRMGLCGPDDPISHATPKVGIVGPAATFVTPTGEELTADDHDVMVRMVSMMAPHPAIGLTSAVAVAVAASRPDSVVAQLSSSTDPSQLRIGTAAGVVVAEVTTDSDGCVAGVGLHRAARRIATAELFVAAAGSAAPALVA
ncbi:PrpF domain-containing protein [Williamsia serinedens]|nr:PrpF domain-containing protein [Williamsia serinedens]